MRRFIISSGVSDSMPPPPEPRPSPCCCSSCISRHISSSSESPSTSLYSGPRRLKYTSNTVSNARQCELFFTIVAPSAYLNASRSSMGMCCTASIASRFSVNETGSPALRSSLTKPASRSSMEGLLVHRELFGRLGDVGLVLEQDVQRVLRLLRFDVLDAEQHQRARPVDGLADRRRLLQVELADAAYDAGDLVGQVGADLGHLGEHDLLLALHVRVVDVEV